MYAFGRCCKKDGWLLSIYKGVGDRYFTLKIRKVNHPPEDTHELKLDEDGLAIKW